MALPHLTILGGGIAGLSAGFFARTNGLSFTLYEARDRVGGNCVTLDRDGFRFDSGAHRFHDKDAAITEVMKELLGPDLRRLVRPSKMFSRGVFLDYPASPVNLLRGLGLLFLTRAAFDVTVSRMSHKAPLVSFEDYAVRMYGKTVAERFFLSYTEKLWGVSCGRLQPDVAAKRFQGFGLRTLVDPLRRVLDSKSRPSEGAYYYPEGGIGTISAAMSARCNVESLRMNAPVTWIEHDGRRIRSIEINGRESADVEEVVSTIPLDMLVKSMHPLPPGEILEAARRVRFRNVILVAFFLNRESVSNAAIIYFTDPDFSIIRVYEPRNRNLRMSPPGKTSLVAEIPCSPLEETWALSDDTLIHRAESELIRAGLVRKPDILGACVHRMPYAYPVPDTALQEHVEKLLHFAGTFGNLKLLGRCGTWQYLWMHDLMAKGRRLVDSYIENSRG